MDSRQLDSFEQVNERLKEIIRLVSDDAIPLDQALDLFEEGAMLGMQASAMLEDDIVVRNENDTNASAE